MANEPNKAEEELKRYAAERRAEAPSELHAATRRLLQGEVARTYGKPRENSAWWKRLLLAPRFAWAVSLAAIFGISILVLRQPPRRDVTTQEAAGARELEEVKQLSSSREDATAQRDEKKEADTTVLTDAAASGVSRGSAPAVVLTAPKVSAPVAEAEKRIATKAEPSGEVRLRKAAESPAPMPASVPTRTARAVAESLDAKEVYFLNRAPQAKDQSAQNSAQVLSRFKMQEAGRRVQFSEADGSTYSGPRNELSGTNSFRVSGTNQTLRQEVVFTGQYYRMANQAQNAQPAQDSFSQNQLRVQGQAFVGGSNQVQVDAQAPAQ